MAQRNSPLRLRFAEGEVTVSAQTQDVGEARESLPVGFTGEPLEIGFNAEFLRDGIESVEADEVQLRLISPLRPGLLQGAGRRLLVPDHADPPRRLIVTAVSLANFRSYARLELSLEPGLVLAIGRERRRQDEPARVAARRHAGLLAADALRRGADPLRRDRRADRSSTAPRGGGGADGVGRRVDGKRPR